MGTIANETRLVDYSFSRPKPADIKRSGYVGVLRYLSQTAGKNLTPDEARALHREGLSIGLVWETTATRATEGESAGAADRAEAERQAHALGYPKACPIFFAVDEDAQGSRVLPYFAGVFRANSYPAGPYGSNRVVDAVVARHPKAYTWQTAAWSGGVLSKHADLYQRVGHEAPAVAGGGYDENVVCRSVPLWGSKGPVVVSPGGVKGKPSPKPRPKPKPPVVKPPKSKGPKLSVFYRAWLRFVRHWRGR